MPLLSCVSLLALHFSASAAPAPAVGRSAIVEARDKLPSGLALADVHVNPLLGKLVLGQTIHDVKTVSGSGDLAPGVLNETSSNPVADPQKEWTDHQLVTLYANGTQQAVGFPFELWEQLKQTDNHPRYVTRPGAAQQNGSSDNVTRRWVDDPAKRWIITPDQRSEVCDTRGVPYATTGLVTGPGFQCTGASPALP
ncbi:hypothetical protein GP486_008659 [Trichoglossum hirsutum]|uniref:Uncharacterized protein n=1 Tax=Trichoglossum hirsutum TaxID=265104 RepID=A0A9P8HYC3_9PEZI|nr:hypothetical protein GP486_008659 [Trichoglossum hirsutum]